MADAASKQVSRIGYDTRFTTMCGVSTLRLWKLSLHGGLSLTDVRVKELMVNYYWDQPSHSAPGEIQKNLIGGGINLRKYASTNNRISIHVSDTTWTHYQSGEALYVPANTPFTLSMSAGGFVTSAMLVDLLKVIKLQ